MPSCSGCHPAVARKAHFYRNATYPEGPTSMWTSHNDFVEARGFDTRPLRDRATKYRAHSSSRGHQLYWNDAWHKLESRAGTSAICPQSKDRRAQEA